MPVLGEQFRNAPGRVIGYARQQVGEVVLRIEAIELRAFNQRVHGGSTSAPGIGAGEEIIFAADRDTS